MNFIDLQYKKKERQCCAYGRHCFVNPRAASEASMVASSFFPAAFDTREWCSSTSTSASPPPNVLAPSPTSWSSAARSTPGSPVASSASSAALLPSGGASSRPEARGEGALQAPIAEDRPGLARVGGGRSLA